MARRNKNTNNRRSDETFDFSSEAAPAPKKIKKTFAAKVTHTSPKLTEIEDRRTWHPSGKTRSARSINKAHHRLVITKKQPQPASVSGRRTSAPIKKKSGYLPHRVQFEAPEKVLVCIRRKQRKQVLFALRKTGKGARARRHRQSYYSSIGC